jgi:putative redox protein
MTPTSTNAERITNIMHATWQGEQRFAVGRPIGPTALIDAGGVQAPGPVDMLLGAVAACSGVDVVDILAKRRTPVETFQIVVTGERRGAVPRRVVQLSIEYRITGANIVRDDAERAIALAVEKYCSVISSLASDIPVSTQLTLNGETYPASERSISR